MSIVSIPQRTRQNARISIRNLRNTGKVARIIDKGQHLAGFDRWLVVAEVATAKAKTKARKAKPYTPNNVGFDIRPVETGIKGYDVYLNGEFVLCRDTKIDAYADAVRTAQRAKIDYSSLKY